MNSLFRIYDKPLLGSGNGEKLVMKRRASTPDPLGTETDISSPPAYSLGMHRKYYIAHVPFNLRETVNQLVEVSYVA